jgi:hypothetical protein
MSLPVGVQTALISAGVAAIITLAIEWLAKPRLEARKDRILEGARVRRDLRARLFALSYKVRLLPVDIREYRGMSAEKVKDIRVEVQRLGDDAMKLEYIDGADRWLVVIQPLIGVQGRLEALLTVLERAQEDEDEGSDELVEALLRHAEQANEKVIRTIDALLMHRWRFIAWRRAVAKATTPAVWPS